MINALLILSILIFIAIYMVSAEMARSILVFLSLFTFAGLSWRLWKRLTN